MALIPLNDQNILMDKFENELADPVNIAYFTRSESSSTAPGQECRYCEDTRQLLEEVAALSDKINLTVYDVASDAAVAKRLDIDKVPAIIVDSGVGDRVRYFGIPAGYEFSSLIEDIVDVSQHTTHLSAATTEALQNLEVDVHIQVFVTPT